MKAFFENPIFRVGGSSWLNVTLLSLSGNQGNIL